MKLWIKIAMVAAMTLAILIPLAMVRGVIEERQAYRAQAVADIARSYAGPQTFAGPVLIVPYVETVTASERDPHGVEREVRRERSGHWTFFPTTLDVRGPVQPDTRRRGLHEVRVYRWNGTAQAHFDVRVPDDAAPDANRRIGRPWLGLAVSDVRGLLDTPRFQVDGRARPVVEGFGRGEGGGVHVRLDAPAPGQALRFDVRADFVLGGTERLALIPLGRSNRFALASTWPHPSFGGSFLTRSNDVRPDGFNADWDIASVATGAQRQFLKRESGQLDGVDSVSVALMDPIDVYTQADRATKYGVLFVLLTFVGFFMFELIRQQPVHPIQYGLVGLALALFFLLLVSLSEHVAFVVAYLVAALACIGLITFYLAAALRGRLRALGFGGMLVTLYAALYGLLVSEDLALVLGAGLLFAVLAAIMIGTRHLDWYQLAGAAARPGAAPREAASPSA